MIVGENGGIGLRFVALRVLKTYLVLVVLVAYLQYIIVREAGGTVYSLDMRPADVHGVPLVVPVHRRDQPALVRARVGIAVGQILIFKATQIAVYRAALCLKIVGAEEGVDVGAVIVMDALEVVDAVGHVFAEVEVIAGRRMDIGVQCVCHAYYDVVLQILDIKRVGAAELLGIEDVEHLVAGGGMRHDLLEKHIALGVLCRRFVGAVPDVGDRAGIADVAYLLVEVMAGLVAFDRELDRPGVLGLHVIVERDIQAAVQRDVHRFVEHCGDLRV